MKDSKFTGGSCLKQFALSAFCVLALTLTGCSKGGGGTTIVAASSNVEVPVISLITLTDGTLTVDWTIDTAVSGFELYVRPAGSESFSIDPIVLSGAVRTYSSDELLNSGVGDYYFKIRAIGTDLDVGGFSANFRFSYEGYKASAAIWDTFTLGGSSATFDSPRGVVVDSEGNIFVSDMFNNRIVQLDSEGNAITSFGSRGSGSQEFFSPMGLAVDSSGLIYVADANNNRVVRFDPDNFSSSFTTIGRVVDGDPASGTGLGEFSFPVDIAIAADDTIYVSDRGNARVQTLELDSGALSSATAAEFLSSSTLTGPWGLEVSGNVVYVLDTNASKMMAYNSSAELQFTISGLTDARGVAVEKSSGEIYISDYVEDSISVYTASGVKKTEWGTDGTDGGEFNQPLGLAFVGETLYVAEFGNDRIQIFE
jgi:DNA-binding beta-propeller fold protein YncE